jgi:ParB-like chromosome segregation protein Spo0J
MSRPGRSRSRWVEIPTEQVQIDAQVHGADWPRRAELVPSFAERVAQVRELNHWKGDPLRVRQDGEGYVLVTGFSRLAIAVEAGLPTVRAVVEPVTTELELARVQLRPWQEKARLNPEKLAQRREQARQRGSLPVPLQVRPAQDGEPDGYVLLDGLYWYQVAREMGLDVVRAEVRRPKRR